MEEIIVAICIIGTLISIFSATNSLSNIDDHLKRIEQIMEVKQEAQKIACHNS